MHDSRDELDRLLDSALANYADPGPDSGLEGRIMSRMATETSPAPRRRWLAWAIALPAAAALLLFILFSYPWTNPPSSTPQQANVTQQQAAPSIEAANRPPSRPTPIRRSDTLPGRPHPSRKPLSANPAPLPKLDIFPTLQPLSPQEQALVDFAERATKSERESLIAAQRQADAPLRIAAIEIKPLEPSAAGAN